MANEAETSLRGPGGYGLARAAIDEMEAVGVWPTPTNFELWIQILSTPDGPLAREVADLLTVGAINDLVSERLAAAWLPRMRLGGEIADTGNALGEELRAVSGAVRNAQQSTQAYGRTLDGAERSLNAGNGSAAPELKSMVANLTGATRRAREDTDHLVRRLVDSAHEVHRLKESLEQASRDASTDGLTGLANRRAFDRELQNACTAARADRDGAEVALAMLDIDNFKLFNDRWGHQTGDQVIRFVGSVVGRNAAAPRLAARYGGEEFAILFTGESPAQVERALETIRTGVASRMLKRRSTNEELGAISISAGFARRRPRESWRDLIERVDIALYASKHGGRDRVTNADAVEIAA